MLDNADNEETFNVTPTPDSSTDRIMGARVNQSEVVTDELEALGATIEEADTTGRLVPKRKQAGKDPLKSSF